MSFSPDLSIGVSPPPHLVLRIVTLAQVLLESQLRARQGPSEGQFQKPTADGAVDPSPAQGEGSQPLVSGAPGSRRSGCLAWQGLRSLLLRPRAQTLGTPSVAHHCTGEGRSRDTQLSGEQGCADTHADTRPQGPTERSRLFTSTCVVPNAPPDCVRGSRVCFPVTDVHEGLPDLGCVRERPQRRTLVVCVPMDKHVCADAHVCGPRVRAPVRGVVCGRGRTGVSAWAHM